MKSRSERGQAFAPGHIAHANCKINVGHLQRLQLHGDNDKDELSKSLGGEDGDEIVLFTFRQLNWWRARVT